MNYLKYMELETASYNLYHSTDIEKALSILKTKTLILSDINKQLAVDNHDVKTFKAKYKYVGSFSRSLDSDFVDENIDAYLVSFILDIEALKKVRGVSIKPFSSLNPIVRGVTGTEEKEEKIFSINKEINIESAIKEIRVGIPHSFDFFKQKEKDKDFIRENFKDVKRLAEFQKRYASKYKITYITGTDEYEFDRFINSKAPSNKTDLEFMEYIWDNY